jgi:hypothetical protein
MLAVSGKTPGTATPSRTANRESLKLRGDVDASTRPVQLLAQKIVEVVATSEARPHVPPKWTMDFEAHEVGVFVYCVCVWWVGGRKARVPGGLLSCLLCPNMSRRSPFLTTTEPSAIPRGQDYNRRGDMGTPRAITRRNTFVGGPSPSHSPLATPRTLIERLNSSRNGKSFREEPEERVLRMRLQIVYFPDDVESVTVRLLTLADGEESDDSDCEGHDDDDEKDEFGHVKVAAVPVNQVYQRVLPIEAAKWMIPQSVLDLDCVDGMELVRGVLSNTAPL